MHTCSNCQTKYDADETDNCPTCGTPIINETCPDCGCVYDPTFYGENNCPMCHGN